MVKERTNQHVTVGFVLVLLKPAGSQICCWLYAAGAVSSVRVKDCCYTSVTMNLIIRSCYCQGVYAVRKFIQLSQTAKAQPRS